MSYSDEDLERDVERVKSISIIPTLLNVICETTGMGFAAIARVTDKRWITCFVRDDINFGLVPGSELKIETTICNGIRDDLQPVIIDNVKEDDFFCEHPVPLLYGFQSYISFPIVLKSGEFFGTLCAIDPQPHKLEKPSVIGMFTAFAELISFHLQQDDEMRVKKEKIRELNRDLANSRDENRQYQHVSSHTLQEPLRKLKIFSGMLIEALQSKQFDKAELLASRMQKGADRFSILIDDLTEFSNLNVNKTELQLTDLNEIIASVHSRLIARLDEISAKVIVGELPALLVYPDQIEQLFYHLFDNAIKFAKKDVPLEISVSAIRVGPSGNSQLSVNREYVEIRVTDNGIGIDEAQLEKIFDMFSQLPTEIFVEGVGAGLSLSRKVIRNHYGQISITSDPGIGTTVIVILPLS